MFFTDRAFQKVTYNKYLLLSLLFVLFLCLFMASCSPEDGIEPDLTGKKVTLVAPGEGIQSLAKTPMFYWNELNGATQYELQIVTPRFDSIVQFISDTLIVDNKISITLDTGKYQWRVRGKNYASQGDYSDVRDLTVE